jgi:hypothetical protein
MDGTIGTLPFLNITKGVLHLDAANGADSRWYSGIRCAAPPGGVFVRLIMAVGVAGRARSIIIRGGLWGVT